jgi:hypothetical protein
MLSEFDAKNSGKVRRGLFLTRETQVSLYVHKFSKIRGIIHLHGSKVAAVLVRRGNSHVGVNGRGRSWAVGGSSRTRVVLRAAPAQTDAGITNGVALHLVDGHLSSVALNELDETAALSGRDLDVGDLAESLEEGAKLVLGNVARKTTNKDGGVVGVSELVHGLGSAVEAHRRTAHGRGVDTTSRTTGHSHTATRTDTRALVLGSSSGDAHGTVTTVDTLHLAQSALLVVLVGEANEAVATRHAANWVGHDLSGLARGEAALEKRHENVFVDFRAEVTDEDRVFRSTLVTAAVSETTSGSPVELECASGVWHGGAVESKGLGSGGGGSEIDKAVASIASAVNISSTWKECQEIALTRKTCRESS